VQVPDFEFGFEVDFVIVLRAQTIAQLGAIVYYLYFASPNKTGDRIVRHIFGMFRDRGVSSGS
jgi:hypothetical protein